MSVIYEPKGKAREYSPLALNLYLECAHGCKYCYAPAIQRKGDGYYKVASPRNNIIKLLGRDLERNAPKSQVLLSFIGDVYSQTADDNLATRQALVLLSNHHVPTAVLTKGGRRCLKDMDVFKSFGEHFQIGSTLTFMDERKSLEWEPGAAIPEERLQVLKELHNNGIQTFVSCEPVIEPEETLKLIERTIVDDSVDIYKVGKLNNYRGLDKMIDWADFLQRALRMIRKSGKRVYVKQDLRIAAHDVILYGNEVIADDFCVR